MGQQQIGVDQGMERGMFPVWAGAVNSRERSLVCYAPTYEAAKQIAALVSMVGIAADMLEFPSDHLTPDQWAKQAAMTLRAALAQAVRS